MSEFSRDLDSTSTKLMSYKLESTEKLADAVKIQALALEFDKVLDNIEKVVQYERSKVKVATQGKSRLPAALSQRDCCLYSSAIGEGRSLGNKRSKASTQETDDTDTDKDTCASASDAPEVHDDNEVDSDFDNEAPALISEDSQSDDDDDTASVNSTAKANTQTKDGRDVSPCQRQCPSDDEPAPSWK